MKTLAVFLFALFPAVAAQSVSAQTNVCRSISLQDKTSALLHSLAEQIKARFEGEGDENLPVHNSCFTRFTAVGITAPSRFGIFTLSDSSASPVNSLHLRITESSNPDSFPNLRAIKSLMR